MASLLSFSLPKLAITKATLSSSPTITTTTTTTTTTPEILEEKFSKKGFKFTESNNIPFVELTVRNGSSLKLQIPNAHVSSYKPKVYWKDEDFAEEVLFTVPGKDSSMDRGGIALLINDVSDSSSKASLVTASDWTVKDVDSDAIDALQVELSCTGGNLDLTYIVSLYPEHMATAVIIKNIGRKAATLTSAILSHMKFKKRGRAGIQGFEGCSYCPHPPLSSPFELISPSEAMKMESPGMFDFNPEPEDKLGVWGVQDVPYLILKKKFSRIYGAPPEERLKDIYNTPPNKYETLDQGRKLFFRIIRMGYEDTYVGTPGLLSDKYGKEYFVCTGPAAILEPIVIQPGESWRGAQVIEHDNL